MTWAEIPGWFDWDDLLDEALSLSRDGDVMIEIGSAFGRSTACLARKIIDSHKRIAFYVIDPWRDDWIEAGCETKVPGDGTPVWGSEWAQWTRDLGGPFNAFCQSMRDHAPQELERCRVIRAMSHEVVGMFADASCSLVFIDGSHTYQDVATDIRLYTPLVRQGGIIAGHDYTSEFPGVQKAVREAFGDVPAQRTSWKVYR